MVYARRLVRVCPLLILVLYTVANSTRSLIHPRFISRGRFYFDKSANEVAFKRGRGAKLLKAYPVNGQCGRSSNDDNMDAY